MSEPTNQVALSEPDARLPEERGAASRGRRDIEPRGAGAARRGGLSLTAFAYLGRGLLVSCSVAFLVLEAVQGVIFTVRATEGYSFDILLIFPVLLRAFAQAISYTLPLSLLFGAGLLVGRLNADREITALRSFGASPAQLLAPAAVLGGVLSLGAYWFNADYAPSMRFANRNAEALILDRLGYLGEGWNLPYNCGQFTFWVNHYDGPVLEGIYISKGQMGRGLLLSDEMLKEVKPPSYPLYFIAERGLVTRGTGKSAGKPVIRLQGVNLFYDHRLAEVLERKLARPGAGEKGPDVREVLAAAPPDEHATTSASFLQRVHFDEINYTVDLPPRDPTVKDMSAAQLRQDTARRLERLESARSQGDPDDLKFAAGQYWYAVTEFHRRLALSLCALTFPLCAFALGLFVTSPNRLLPFFLAITVVPSCYFSLEMLGNYLAKRGIVPWATEELGNAATVALTLAILWRLCRAPRG